MKTAVITGAAGFLGSHLAEKLISRGYGVIGYDNLITGNLDNIKHLPKESFLFRQVDISQGMPTDSDVHIVFHFACPASPPDYLKYPLQTLEVGSSGTRNALELARAKRAIFVLASTSEVYGDPLVHPQVETYWGNVNPIGPRSVYDEAKRFSEALTMAYHREYALDTKIVRIFNTYGPRMRPNDGRAVPNFICQALRNEDITIYGDGTQTRSFTYVDDLIDGVWLLSRSGLHEPVNIGNPTELSIWEIAQQIVSLTQSRSRLIYLPLPDDDPKVRRPDITRAQMKLGWQPETPVAYGLRQTIDYFQSKL
ncbi:MAG: SDR family oxidoreductase [Patescibacteria group bacterium]|nr:SDR family oxidoreductase [Patescibacteria group bacterium]